MRSFKIQAAQVNGNDVNAVYQRAKLAIETCPSGDGPVFLECMTYRCCEHVCPQWNCDAHRTYRSKTDFEAWIEKCSVKLVGDSLVATGTVTANDLDACLNPIYSEVNDVMI